MLARSYRITDGAEYRKVVRRGRRSSTPRFVAYIVPGFEESPPRFGFIVSKQVGNAVVRNRVRRRLKAICAAASHAIPQGTACVLRALPPVVTSDFSTVKADVDQLLARGIS